MKVDGLCRHLRYGSTTSEHVSRVYFDWHENFSVCSSCFTRVRQGSLRRVILDCVRVYMTGWFDATTTAAALLVHCWCYLEESKFERDNMQAKKNKNIIRHCLVEGR